MKLKNKKTGEIGYFCSANWDNPVLIIMDKNGIQLAKYNSLAELNEEWEDYEEPKDKGYWYIDDLCCMRYSSELLDEIGDRPNNWMIRKLCGNYFSSREEAELAVRKLKAWKRLKDKGFKFNCWYGGSKDIVFSIPQEIIDRPTAKDLDLLFGGEE